MAIAQSRQVAGMITERTGRPAEIVGVMTLGDVSRAQLTQIGGTGVFVSALREALLAGEVDLAVHSLKDLPAGPAPGIVLAAVPPRDDPRDALAARDGAKLADLPAGARIGTSSPRRAAQLLALRGDLRCVPIRGNTDTRLGKVGSGEVNGVVLACAGLARLGCLHAVTQVFEPAEMLPAPGQGALAVECRDGEPELAALLDAVTDLASLAAVTAERSCWRRCRSTGIGQRRASVLSAKRRPPLARTAGWMPRAISRRSSSAPVTTATARSSSAPSSPSSGGTAAFAARSCSASVTSGPWAPSCRSCSIRRRVWSAAATIRARDAVTSARAWAFATAVAASSVNPASRASVPAGSGARLDAMLTMPHSRPSILAGTPTAVRTPSSSLAGSATGGLGQLR